jgi:tight adherence protein B
MPISTMILLFGGGIGLLMLAVGVAISVLGSRSVVEERLGRYAESGGLVSQTAPEIEEKAERRSIMLDYFNRMGEGTNLFQGISRRLARADLKLRPAEYIAVIIISVFLGIVIGYILSRGFIFASIGGVVGYLAPGWYVTRAEKSRLKKFDGQLGDMLNLMVNGLRAGFSTLQAMEAVSRELPAPICDEFRRVVQEMQLGLSMDDALAHLLRRINSDDLDLVVTAINVQREVGGNLAEILDVISFTIRERVRIKGEIAALTAQGRATAWVISMMPVALLGILFLVNRPYVEKFWSSDPAVCGYSMLCVAAGMVITGFMITQRIVNIDI